MSNDIGDIIRHKDRDTVFMIVDLEQTGGDGHMFHLYNFYTSNVHKWFEPFNQCLASTYWETLA